MVPLSSGSGFAGKQLKEEILGELEQQLREEEGILGFSPPQETKISDF